jgi:hypothetical protein
VANRPNGIAKKAGVLFAEFNRLKSVVDYLLTKLNEIMKWRLTCPSEKCDYEGKREDEKEAK